jgi:hypothetical protein
MSVTARALTGDANGRAVVLHVDDVGMCHGANVAFLELSRSAGVTCGSVMVPCPWFPEIASAAAEDATLDLGVHLTLTSEWPHYRWAPLTTRSRASGLVDEHGYFPRNCLALREHLNVKAADVELRAQVDRALRAGIDATHLDAHMGAALVPELAELYVRLGLDYRLPVLLPRQLDSYTGVLRMGEIPPGLHERQIEALESRGLPMFDHFRMTPEVDSPDVDGTYHRMIESLPPGVTFFALHCNAPGDIEAIVPPRAHRRTNEYRLFGSGAPMRWAADNGIRQWACGRSARCGAPRSPPSHAGDTRAAAGRSSKAKIDLAVLPERPLGCDAEHHPLASFARRYECASRRECVGREADLLRELVHFARAFDGQALALVHAALEREAAGLYAQIERGLVVAIHGSRPVRA